MTFFFKFFLARLIVEGGAWIRVLVSALTGKGSGKSVLSRSAVTHCVSHYDLWSPKLAKAVYLKAAGRPREAESVEVLP